MKKYRFRTLGEDLAYKEAKRREKAEKAQIKFQNKQRRKELKTALRYGVEPGEADRKGQKTYYVDFSYLRLLALVGLMAILAALVVGFVCGGYMVAEATFINL